MFFSSLLAIENLQNHYIIEFLIFQFRLFGEIRNKKWLACRQPSSGLKVTTPGPRHSDTQPATTSHRPRVKMKSNKKKKQPLGTFIYPPSNLTTYLPNQIQTCVYGFGQGKNFQPW
jgi:hypothetical protein